MARYTSGMQVEGGYYWNASNWEVEVVPSEGGRLAGGSSARYVKVPFLALFVIVPVLGGVFLMFLPLIGFGMFAYAIAKRLAGAFTRSATELASTVQPGAFAAGNAYLAGRPGQETTEGEAPASPALDELEKEIAERRK